MLSEFPVCFMKISIMTVLIFTYFLNFQKLRKKKLWVNLPNGSKFIFHVSWVALFEYEIAFSTRYINGLLFLLYKFVVNAEVIPLLGIVESELKYHHVVKFQVMMIDIFPFVSKAYVRK